MMHTRRIAGPVYLVAMLLVLFPLVDALVDVWPLRAGIVNWRFGAAGVFSGAIMMPAFGLVVAFVTALLLQHRVVARLVSVLSFLASTLLVGAALLFVLDALQVRAEVPTEAMTRFMVVSVAALVKVVLTAVVTTVLAVAAWKSSKKSAKRGSGRRPADVQSVLLQGGTG